MAQRPVLREISLRVQSGTFVAPAWPNGASKIDVLNTCSGLLNPKSRHVQLRSAEKI